MFRMRTTSAAGIHRDKTASHAFNAEQHFHWESKSVRGNSIALRCQIPIANPTRAYAN